MNPSQVMRDGVNCPAPEGKAHLKEYESGATADLAKEIMKGSELAAAADADVAGDLPSTGRSQPSLLPIPSQRY